MRNHIHMVDLKSQYTKIKSDVDASIQEVIDTTSFINGKAVTEFADAFATYTGINNVVTCGNGTDAIQIALMTLGLEPGDEVVLPVHTYVATAEVIALLRLKPVFVDVDLDTFNISVEEIENVITPKTKAIVPVHLYGQCADMEPILTIAKKHGLFVVEDTAQATGATYTFADGKTMKAGTMGDIGCTSFFPSKNLGCFGDGGAMLINDDQLAIKAKMIANHGQSVKYHHDIIGCNSRLDTIQAAVLKVKLPHLDNYNLARNSVALRYFESLNSQNKLALPIVSKNSSHVYHQYTVRIQGTNRDEVKFQLQEAGIPSMIYYPIPLHRQKAFIELNYTMGSFPRAEELSETVLSLPIHTEMAQSQQDFITDTLINILNG
jgi:UDP-2-acetamido-2-deoxy-ribo-hexuluronate aminotransferase